MNHEDIRNMKGRIFEFSTKGCPNVKIRRIQYESGRPLFETNTIVDYGNGELVEVEQDLDRVRGRQILNGYTARLKKQIDGNIYFYNVTIEFPQLEDGTYTNTVAVNKCFTTSPSVTGTTRRRKRKSTRRRHRR